MSPAKRASKAGHLTMPNTEKDPAERKRVLNVLAQRRYRQRKKEHIKRLENIADTDRSQTTEIQPAGEPVCSGLLPAEVARLDHEPDQVFCTDLEGLLSEPSMLAQTHDESFDFSSDVFTTLDTDISPPSFSASPSLMNMSNTSHSHISLSPNPRSVSSYENFDFPDEAYLPMSELNLLRGAMSIAKRLDVDSIIWSLEANSPFYNSTTLGYDHLPSNLRPTRTQLCNPHHPTLDILPWPSVRDRLILIFSQPDELRPPCARGPTGLVEFVYDLEDPAEGVRIWGDDPYSDENWEVGEKLFKNWWWAFDNRVISRSNQLRRDRGAMLLGA